MVLPASQSPVAATIPFDPDDSGFPPTILNVQDAIEHGLHFDPSYTTDVLFDDFDNRITWSPSTSGAGASASVSGGNSTYASGKHLGVALLQLGTVLSSHASLVQSGNLATSTVFGNGRARYISLVYIPTLATSSDDYIFRCGFGSNTSADHVNGIYFEYNRSLSVNWRLRCASGGARTTTTSNTAVAASTWLRLEWLCNENGSQVDFLVNGAAIGSVTSNIPTTVGAGCGPNFQLLQTAVVAGGRTVAIDYFWFMKHFTGRD